MSNNPPKGKDTACALSFRVNYLRKIRSSQVFLLFFPENFVCSCVYVGTEVRACARACFKHTGGQMGRDVGREGYWRGGVAGPLHLSIKTAELLIQWYSHLTGCAHTQAAHTLTTRLETLLRGSLSPKL